MTPRITSVRHVQNFELEIGFTDAARRVLDFRGRIVGRGGALTPLQRVDYFAQVALDPEAGTIVWPNGVDFCPDVLYAEATGKPASEFDSKLIVW
jgi:hypothetical protein